MTTPEIPFLPFYIVSNTVEVDAAENMYLEFRKKILEFNDDYYDSDDDESMVYDDESDGGASMVRDDEKKGNTRMFEIKEKENGMYYLDASIEESYIIRANCHFRDRVSPDYLLRGLYEGNSFSIKTGANTVSTLGTVKHKKTIKVVLQENDDSSSYVFSVTNDNISNINDIKPFLTHVNNSNQILAFIEFNRKELSDTPTNEISANVYLFQMSK